MSVIDKLQRLHLVDAQIRGLRSRIEGSQRYLDEQDRLLTGIDARLSALTAQIRQIQATVHNDENEMKAVDERIAKLRDLLQNSKTNKEYTALLTELNTLKADRGKVEDRALESMTRLDEVRTAIAGLETEKAERISIRAVALTDRDRRAQEVKDRLDELEAERKIALGDAPVQVLKLYESLSKSRGDNAMAPIEEQSRRNMEYSCGVCQVMLPIELVSAVLGRGEVKQCVSCGAILYIEPALRESMTTAKR